MRQVHRGFYRKCLLLERWQQSAEVSRRPTPITPNEILRKCPKLIPIVCPHRSDSATCADPWDITELSETLERLVKQRELSAKFCFFVDGLDEYEGNHHDIITLLNVMTNCSDIKSCISSRPWNVFEDAYGHESHLKLYLQDLTRNDIEICVRNGLESHNMLMTFSDDEKEEYRNLIEEIINRSQGVFLWVFLVVKSLGEGMTNGDSIFHLQRWLRSLPVDLEKFFQHILQQVEDLYQQDMARTFRQALQATELLTLIEHSFLEEADNFAIDTRICEIDMYRIDSRNLRTRRRIAARCKGLMEVCSDLTKVDRWAHTVEFLHRTVHDSY